MKSYIRPGDPVRYAAAGSVLATIEKYAGNGFYILKNDGDIREMVAHEDDLIPDLLYSKDLCREELKYRGRHGKARCYRCVGGNL